MNSIAPQLVLTDELLNEVAERPYSIDLFALMRRLEATTHEAPKWGHANKYCDELLQFGQEPSSIFANASIAKVYQYSNGRKPKVAIHSFGLFGPNGALPLVFTEYVKERMAHHGDYALSDFIDIFHNRMIMLFYRAWADTNSCANMDNAEEKFTAYIASICASSFTKEKTDSIPLHARWHNAGHLLRQARNAEGLKNILKKFFRVPVHIEEFVARWLPLHQDEQTRLGKFKGTQLGFDAVLGQKIMSKQYHFRIQLGPLNQDEYDQFLPNTTKHQQLRDWVRTYIGMELTWDLQLLLKPQEMKTGVRLGTSKYLGWNTWMGKFEKKELAPPPPSTRHTFFKSVIFNPECNRDFENYPLVIDDTN